LRSFVCVVSCDILLKDLPRYRGGQRDPRMTGPDVIITRKNIRL
jgi:hypothetical protein